MTRIDWAANTQPTPDGHLLWTGARGGRKGELRISRSDHRSPRRYAYIEHHGRQPEGAVLSDCGQRLCVEPDHLTDRADRQLIGSVAAIANGLTQPFEGTCPRGHPWTETAWFNRNGRRRCLACQYEGTPADLDEIAVEEAVSGRPVQLTRHERIEAARVLTVRGYSTAATAERLGVSGRTVTRWRVAKGWKAAA